LAKYFKFVVESIPQEEKQWYVRPHHLASVS